ncbi:hypothetical protein [Pseudoalteromonas ruthenica]|uniref:hypothetical protein n=1 Tax=Pseudoalteromonas ruthenica TaxID=151081 RepID=UPI0012483F7B|nr:hypothetical protein [Pseudoalteromonas ruthenica]
MECLTFTNEDIGVIASTAFIYGFLGIMFYGLICDVGSWSYRRFVEPRLDQWIDKQRNKNV